MTTVRDLLDDLPEDERTAALAALPAVGIDPNDSIEDMDEIAVRRLRQFLLRRREQMKRRVELLKRQRG